MILFFGSQDLKIFAVQCTSQLAEEAINKLVWLFGDQPKIEASVIDAFFIGPRAFYDYAMEYQCDGNHPKYGD